MEAHDSKNHLLYRQVRRALQSGRYAPGQRIDPATLAAEFHTSPTPVRMAMYRLVGEGLLVDHARTGMYVPLPTELALRDLYDWMERLLLLACDLGLKPPAREDDNRRVRIDETDVVKGTWQLFDAIAKATDHRSLHQAVKRANNQLSPVRRAKLGMFEGTREELVEVQRFWEQGDAASLRCCLAAYHARRKRMVPAIVALLLENHDRLY